MIARPQRDPASAHTQSSTRQAEGKIGDVIGDGVAPQRAGQAEAKLELTSNAPEGARTPCRALVQPREARQQRMHIVRRGFAVGEQDAVADRGDQDVDRFVDRKCGLAALEGAAVEGLQMMGRVGQ